MSSDSDTEESSCSESWPAEELSCALPRAPCRPIPQPLRRLVDVGEPSGQPKYSFSVLYNERIPTGSRVEIQPQQKRMPFKPSAPLDPPDRDQDLSMWGGRFGVHNRHEMYGFDPERNNGNASELDRFSPSPYPFSSVDGFNTTFDFMRSGLAPKFGSRVRQGMGDTSQRRLEIYTGARGYQVPKREVELSHPRNQQPPVQFYDRKDWQQRIAASLSDKKPFELPFQQGRDTGDRSLPFSGAPLHPPLRILDVAGLRQSQPLPFRINNIPSQAQADPTNTAMQGYGKLGAYREPMFDTSDFVRTPAATPTQNFNPPLMSAPVRITPTNRSDTTFEWRGPINNSSADAVQAPQIYTQTSRVSVEENPLSGPVGNESVGAGGYLATVTNPLETQRGGDEWMTGPGPAFGGGQGPLKYADQFRPTMKQVQEEASIMPRIVRSGVGQGPLHYADEFRTTTKETLETSSIMAPMQNTGPSAPTLHYADELKPTLKDSLAEVIQPPRMQLPQGGGPIMPYLDDFRPTGRQQSEAQVFQGRVGGAAVGSAPVMHYSDQMRETTKQTTESQVIQGRVGGAAVGTAPVMHYSDQLRETTKQTTEEASFAGRIGGEAAGKGAVRHYDDEARDTRRQFDAETLEAGPAFNSSASAGGHVATNTYAKLTERNMGEEETYSFGPVEAGTKSPMDRSYLRNITLDDRREALLYNRIPARSQTRAVPRNVFGNWSLPSDEEYPDMTRTANPNYSREGIGRPMPAYRYSDSKDHLQVNEYRFIEPYQTAQLRTNPYATDVRVIAGQPQY